MSDPSDQSVVWRLVDERIRQIVGQIGRGGGGDGGGDATLPARVARLEEQFQQIGRQLDRLEAQTAKAVDVAEIKGRVSQLPTVWQMAGLVLAILGAAFAILRFGLPR